MILQYFPGYTPLPLLCSRAFTPLGREPAIPCLWISKLNTFCLPTPNKQCSFWLNNCMTPAHTFFRVGSLPSGKLFTFSWRQGVMFHFSLFILQLWLISSLLFMPLFTLTLYGLKNLGFHVWWLILAVSWSDADEINKATSGCVWVSHGCLTSRTTSGSGPFLSLALPCTAASWIPGVEQLQQFLLPRCLCVGISQAWTETYEPMSWNKLFLHMVVYAEHLVATLYSVMIK